MRGKTRRASTPQVPRFTSGTKVTLDVHVWKHALVESVLRSRGSSTDRAECVRSHELFDALIDVCPCAVRSEDLLRQVQQHFRSLLKELTGNEGVTPVQTTPLFRRLEERDKLAEVAVHALTPTERKALSGRAHRGVGDDADVLTLARSADGIFITDDENILHRARDLTSRIARLHRILSTQEAFDELSTYRIN